MTINRVQIQWRFLYVGAGGRVPRLACAFGVPRFVPSVRKEHFRLVEDLGLDEAVHLLAQLDSTRLHKLKHAARHAKHVCVFKVRALISLPLSLSILFTQDCNWWRVLMLVARSS